MKLHFLQRHTVGFLPAPAPELAASGGGSGITMAVFSSVMPMAASVGSILLSDSSEGAGATFTILWPKEGAARIAAE